MRSKTWKIGIVNASKQMGQSRTFRSSSAGESLLSGEDLEDRFLFCVRMLLAPSFSPETGTEAPTMVGGLTLHPRNLNPLYCFFFYCSGCSRVFACFFFGSDLFLGKLGPYYKKITRIRTTCVLTLIMIFIFPNLQNKIIAITD